VVAGRLELFHTRQERERASEREREREREGKRKKVRARERDAAGHGFSHYLRGAVVNGITSMAAREVTLHDHSTHWPERIQIYHISLLQFTQIKKSLCVHSMSYRYIMKTARLYWSK
jgi:hypothetical protein